MLRDLSHFRLFSDLDTADLKLLSPLFLSRTYPEDAVLFHIGDPAECVYLVLTGEVMIQYKPYDGPPMNLARVRQGGVVGWSAVLGNPQYKSAAVCATEVTALMAYGDDLRRLCAEHPRTGQLVLDRLAVAVSGRWKNAQTQIRGMLQQGLNNGSSGHTKGGGKVSTASSFPIEKQLRALVEQLSAYIETYHGGSVQFVSFDGKTLKVRLGGACLGCPLSPATLHGWVEGTVRQFFPEIKSVEAD
jgi:CRP-like cAMP-binding protein/Fe-S cluster biogenesis protein NfuA